MNSIEKKDVPDVSGGYSPTDGGCMPVPIDYPQCPGGPRDPYPMPLIQDPTAPDQPV